MRFEQLAPGLSFRTEAVEVTEADIRSFAAAYDPQPLHLDTEAAARGWFGGLIASGYHTLALSWRAWIDAGVFGEDSIAGLGLDRVRWRRPVVAGERLSVDVRVLESRPSASHPGTGVVRLSLRVRNQDDVPVLTYEAAALVRGRGA